jgi:hypothetical protein
VILHLLPLIQLPEHLRSVFATMPRLFKTLAGLSLASLSLSSPLNARQNGTGTPCAAVSASAASQKGVATPTVPAQLAYECITSVPFNQSAALALVDGVVPYFRWQSNTVWLKDPPAEYAEKVQPGIDVWGGLEEIRSKVVSGDYENEYTVCAETTSGCCCGHCKS